jgi:hypothetical protein
MLHPRVVFRRPVRHQRTARTTEAAVPSNLLASWVHDRDTPTVAIL